MYESSVNVLFFSLLDSFNIVITLILCAQKICLFCLVILKCRIHSSVTYHFQTYDFYVLLSFYKGFMTAYAFTVNNTAYLLVTHDLVL